MEEKKISKETIDNIIKIIDIRGNNEDKINKIKKMLEQRKSKIQGNQNFQYPSGISVDLKNKSFSNNQKIFKQSDGLDEIEQLLNYLKLLSIDVEFDVSLARGLSYYTGTVFEVFLKNSKVKSAVCGGGRYDEMIGEFLGKGNYPAVGISFGLERIYDAYVEKNKEEKKTITQIYIIPIKTFNESVRIAEELRREGIKVDIDLSNKSPSKNLEYANSLNMPYVLFVGEEELRQKKVKLRDMKTGEENLLTAKELVVFLSKFYPKMQNI